MCSEPGYEGGSAIKIGGFPPDLRGGKGVIISKSSGNIFIDCRLMLGGGGDLDGK